MNKATVLVVLILVSVAFSAPVLANGYEESHEHAEYDSQPDGWLDTGTEESRTEHEGRVGHEDRVGYGEATPGQEEAIPQPAVPVTPPTPAEEPLSDDELVAAILTAALTAGVFGRDEIKEVITALRKWNLSGRPGGLTGLGDMIFEEKPAETVTTQQDTAPTTIKPAETVTPGEKPVIKISEQEMQDTVDWGIKHNRSPEDIQKDLNSRNETLGGSGNVPTPEPLVSVEVPGGHVTALESEAIEYQKLKDKIKEGNDFVEIHKNRLKELENESQKWVDLEMQVIGRWVAGTGALYKEATRFKESGVVSELVANIRKMTTTGKVPLEQTSWLNRPLKKLEEIGDEQEWCTMELRNMRDRLNNLEEEKRIFEQRAK